MGLLLVSAVVVIVLLLAITSIEIKLWRKGPKGRIAAVMILCGMGSVAYFAIYPTDEFYRAEFEHVTGLAFPQGATFLFRKATYPDLTGDYMSCAVIAVSEEQYDDLRSKMRPAQASPSSRWPSCFGDSQRWPGDRAIAIESIETPLGEYKYWALVADRAEVIIFYVKT
jgi:hypothetical protein